MTEQKVILGEARWHTSTQGGQPALDLIVTMDDATSAIYSAFLVEEEGTDSTFRALDEVFSRHGLPLRLYTDRGSHYFHTPAAGGAVDRRTRLTRVGRRFLCEAEAAMRATSAL